MGRRLSTMFDGLGWATGIAAVLMVLSLLSLLLISQSSFDRLQWTGASVIGDERSGLVFYVYKGESNTLDVKGFASNPHFLVHVDKSDPSIAEADSPVTRAVDAGVVLGPLALGAAAMAVGVARRSRERRRARARGAIDGFGQGLSDDFVQRKLEELRGSSRDRPPGGPV